MESSKRKVNIFTNVHYWDMENGGTRDAIDLRSTLLTEDDLDSFNLLEYITPVPLGNSTCGENIR